VKVGSLFSGIGGFDLGLERAGMRVIWQSEIDPYASAVLRKHWPHVPNHGDIRNIRAGTVEPVDVLCGGFPCQDISSAGYKAGIAGSQSRLWAEYARLVGELQPRYVLVENVAALLSRGLGNVLGDLAALGFDAEWHCIPAAAVGAYHGRDRLWIIGYANGNSQSGRALYAKASGCAALMADPECWLGPLGRYLARAGRAGELDARTPWDSTPEDQPDFLGVDARLPARMDRLRALGNSIVPQVAEVIGRAVMAAA
jgi:DNA (cytosine-5)-methyltransferase 1